MKKEIGRGHVKMSQSLLLFLLRFNWFSFIYVPDYCKILINFWNFGKVDFDNISIVLLVLMEK